MDELLDEYFTLRKLIHEKFGYTEDWRVFQMDDERSSVWCLVDDSSVEWADTLDALQDPEGSARYGGSIYTYRHLSQYVYRTETHTMVLVDTQCDGNILLMIFTNAKEVPAAVVQARDEEED